MKDFRKKFIEEPQHLLEEKLVNHLIKAGKKKQAEKILIEAKYFLKKFSNDKKLISKIIKTNKSNKKFEDLPKLNPDRILMKAVENASPMISLRSRRKGSQNLTVPFPLRKDQRYSKGLKSIVFETRKKAKLKKNLNQWKNLNLPIGNLISYLLATTLLETSLNKGEVVRKQKEFSKEINRNRVNSFMRW